VEVIAWRTVSGITDNVSNGTLNLTHSLTHSLIQYMQPGCKNSGDCDVVMASQCANSPGLSHCVQVQENSRD